MSRCETQFKSQKIQKHGKLKSHNLICGKSVEEKQARAHNGWNCSQHLPVIISGIFRCVAADGADSWRWPLIYTKSVARESGFFLVLLL